ncbi:transcriptional coactivator/pterin dehydratase [Lophiostoma macrostomum CBS 122681]|uniref:4a-hydroxytetrahydrobiopterin dehydratase n=1 Tax=Lophiostoma macrostomum CBS 122681 TaxID=1314788 RepID=A0A6A6SRE4_9PLEO|nr:transcriptional coactivator/pterin dehydratase [Lophiostoma macrostomum CBS 122681]
MLTGSTPTGNVRAASSQSGDTFGPQASAGGEAATIIFSENQPPDLSNRVSHLTAWTITPSRMGLIRRFTFPSFGTAWRFMSTVAEECKAKRHHPSWHNLYNQVTVEWTTHKPLGLSIKDVEMAEFCDRIAEENGLKVPTQSAGRTNSSTPASN